jgi:hypothetical protein
MLFTNSMDYFYVQTEVIEVKPPFDSAGAQGHCNPQSLISKIKILLVTP